MKLKVLLTGHNRRIAADISDHLKNDRGCFAVSCYYMTAFFLRWISPSAVSDCFIMFLLFLIPYLMIWLSKYLSYKSQINEINKELIMLKASEYADSDAA